MFWSWWRMKNVLLLMKKNINMMKCEEINKAWAHGDSSFCSCLLTTGRYFLLPTSLTTTSLMWCFIKKIDINQSLKHFQLKRTKPTKMNNEISHYNIYKKKNQGSILISGDIKSGINYGSSDLFYLPWRRAPSGLRREGQQTTQLLGYRQRTASSFH